MAYTLEQWKEAKMLYEVGDKTLREIESLTGISNGQISKRAKKDNWEKGSKKKQIKSDIIDLDKKESKIRKQKEAILNEVALSFDDYEITLLQDIIETETKTKSLVLSTASLALIRTNQLLTKNQTIEKINVGDGVQQFEPRELNTTDLKNIADTVDKISITTGINDRHSKSSVEVNNANLNTQPTQINIVRDN